MKADQNTPPPAPAALQQLYRELIEAYIAAAPADYRDSLRHLQQRIDDASQIEEDEVHAFAVLSKLFKELGPGRRPGGA